ncbi:hypothetical protein AHF37_12793 [Paragonimus kellicotti]|nr:hypothetical protein AHF37_12793 [Paragonimus kellicotti]
MFLLGRFVCPVKLCKRLRSYFIQYTYAQLAGKLGARAASHLEEASPAGVAAMAASGTAAVLLPTTAQLLRLRPPPARAIIQAGVPVALGTDFNPNAYCLSMVSERIFVRTLDAGMQITTSFSFWS